MKISFDFDGTIEFDSVQEFAKKVIKSGHDVCIITTRYEKYNNADVYIVADKLGIKEVIFTNFVWKYKIIDKYGIDIHFDDYEPEISWINDYTNTIALKIDDYIHGYMIDYEIKNDNSCIMIVDNKGSNGI